MSKRNSILTILSKFKLPLIISLFLIFSIIGVIFYIFSPPESVSLPKDFSEVQDLKERNMSFDTLKQYFTELSQKKGAVYAYEVLKVAPMPPNTDMHLMGHVVGEQLYKQQGAEGMKHCTQEFRNACSHTIVVGLLLDKGEGALNDIAKGCKQAPGGPGAYTMCYHGLGHGVLAYTNYDFPKTFELCKKTGTRQYNYQEFPECVGGAIMEQISGGDHDKQTWTRQREVNLKADDPLYPCNSNLLTDTSPRTFCYIYITPHLFNSAGENLFGIPSVETITKAFTFCEQIPSSETRFRNACFGGFGKEFVVLAKDRDIRNVANMNESELKKVYSWCNLTPIEEGQLSCIEHALSSLFWGGENDPAVSIKFCSLLSNTHQSVCFNSLVEKLNQYTPDKKRRDSICQALPEQYITTCLNK
jgi:hypothetical protein